MSLLVSTGVSPGLYGLYWSLLVSPLVLVSTCVSPGLYGLYLFSTGLYWCLSWSLRSLLVWTGVSTGVYGLYWSLLVSLLVSPDPCWCPLVCSSLCPHVYVDVVKQIKTYLY